MGSNGTQQIPNFSDLAPTTQIFPRMHWIFGLCLACLLFGAYLSFATFGPDEKKVSATDRHTNRNVQFSYLKRDGSLAFPEKKQLLSTPKQTNQSTPAIIPDTTKNEHSTPAIPDPEPHRLMPIKPQADHGSANLHANSSAQQLPGISTVQSTVKPGDSLFKIFSRLGLSQNTLEKIVASYNDPASPLKYIYPGQVIDFEIDTDTQTLHSFAFDKDKLTKVVIARDSEGNFSITERSKTLQVDTRYAQGDIQDAFYLAAKRAGLGDKTILEFADIFAWDVDFSLDIRQNDRFEVYYERNHLEDGSIEPGRILAARFFNRNKWITAIAFTDPSGHTSYYTPKGNNVRKAFLRSPVDFARISSHFNLRRRHPVLHTIRAHKGVDYAAKRGTPIKATGDGKVFFKGRKGGYGRVVILQHGKKYSTLYAHLQGYAKSLKQGQRVRQGEVIGFIGSSGLATGPHLHYEFRVNNVHKNPLTVKFPNAAPIAKKYRAQFDATASERLNLMAKLKQQSTLASQSTPASTGG